MYLFAFQIDQKGTYICIFWCTYNKDNKCRGTGILQKVNLNLIGAFEVAP